MHHFPLLPPAVTAWLWSSLRSLLKSDAKNWRKDFLQNAKHRISPRSPLWLFHWGLHKTRLMRMVLQSLLPRFMVQMLQWETQHSSDVCILRHVLSTFLMADMKSQVSSADPSERVRKLPFVEKQNRLEAQKRRITGLLHNQTSSRRIS